MGALLFGAKVWSLECEGIPQGIWLVARVLGVMECGLAVAVKQLLASVAIHVHHDAQ